MKKFALIVTFFFVFSSVCQSQVNTTVEAESITLSGTYEIKSNDNASNGSFVKSFHTTSIGRLEFKVNITKADTYKLNIFSFNGGTTQDIDLSVNGGTNTTVELQASNWAFEGPSQATTTQIDLVVGDNTIVITTPHVTVLFDKFQVSEVTENLNAYYISTTGDDSNNGSISSPWKTISKANEVLASDSSGGSLQPGAKVLFKSGETFEGNLFINRSGTEEAPIEISSYGTGELPIISGSGNISGGDYFEAIKILNSSHVIVSKIWVKNDRKDGSRYTYGSTNSYGIQLVANKWGGVMKNLTFRDLKVSDVYPVELPSEFNSLKVTGIRLDSEENDTSTEVSIHDVLIEDCYFTHISKAGVWAVHKGASDPNDDTVNRNKNIVVRNNTFFQTGGSGVILSKTYNGLIENNDFDHTGYSTASEPRLFGRGSGAWIWSSRNIIAQYNRSYSIRGSGDSYGMHIDFGNKDVIFQYNYSEDSEGGFCEILGDNVNSTYRFNVSINDGFRDFHGYTLWISGYAGSGKPAIRPDKTYIYNNTIFLNSTIYTPRVSIYALDTYVYNNIFVASNGAKIGYNSVKHGDGVSIDVGTGNLYLENNLFEGDIHNNFSNLGSNSQSGSPLFVNEGGTKKADYNLQSGSPAIDNGKIFAEPSFPMAGVGIFKDITNFSTVDPFGNTIDIQNHIPNIGASNAYNSNSVLGINTIKDLENIFTIYPNPVKDNINIQFTKAIEKADIYVYDIRGYQVFSNSINNSQGITKVKLPENIKNGMYLLKVSNENKSQVKQFILYRQH